MREIWFRNHDGLIWKPVTWQGTFITASWFVANLWAFWHIDKDSHSISDSLFEYAPFFIISSVLYIVIVRMKSPLE